MRLTGVIATRNIRKRYTKFLVKDTWIISQRGKIIYFNCPVWLILVHSYMWTIHFTCYQNYKVIILSHINPWNICIDCIGWLCDYFKTKRIILSYDEYVFNLAAVGLTRKSYEGVTLSTQHMLRISVRTTRSL